MELLEEVRDVFEIAGEPVERLQQDGVEAALFAVPQEPVEAGAMLGRAADGPVVVLGAGARRTTHRAELLA